MKLKRLLLVGVTVGVACGGGEDEGLPEMTPAEHAAMSAGGAQGEMDSTGAAVRQPVHLSTEDERTLGITYATVGRETLERTIRTVGRVEAAEPRIADIVPKIDGFIEDLFVNYTGEAVQRGQPLLNLYSPMLVAAQEELLTAARMAAQVDSGSGEAWINAQAMLEAARRRLEYWDITEEQITQIERTGEVTKTLTFVAPFTGIVLEKDVFDGQQVMSGMRMYRIADLSEVWVEGDVFEQDLRFVHVGSQARIEAVAYPGERRTARVSFVYPTVDHQSRTNRMRVTVPNRDLRLKPGMYTTIYFDVVIGRDILVVPREAIVITGERNVVFVRDAEGILQPREIVMGPAAQGRVQILDGLAEGETIVASANFLVDAESRLAGGAGSMAGMQHGVEPAGEPDTMSSERQHD
jgi:membrane fusion protein, copper/silver efflux system